MDLVTGFDLCRAAMAAPGVTAPERSVLMVLAIMANTDAQCWPPINDSIDGSGLTSRCVLSERAVQRAIQQLVRLGHISRRQLRHGVIYTVHPLTELTPATGTGVNVTGVTGTGDVEAVTPATGAPKLPKTTITPKKASPPLGSRSPKRATSIPANFEPIMTGKTAQCVDGWPPGRLPEELEHFADYHRANGTTSLDWQASWRTWVRNSKKWEPRNATGRTGTGAPRSTDGFGAALREASAFYGADHAR